PARLPRPRRAARIRSHRGHPDARPRGVAARHHQGLGDRRRSGRRRVGAHCQTGFHGLFGASALLTARPLIAAGDIPASTPSCSTRSQTMSRCFGSLVGWLVLAIPVVAQTTDDKKWPAELVRFTSYKVNPVFTAAKGEWDAKIRERGWIMREDGVYKLWYTGY